MTALARYARLETMGLWRPGLGEEAREVVVSFGDATLVLSDGSGRPLTHWSLPALTRLNPGTMPALYAPHEDGSETLEVEDDLMVEAVETVRKTVARARPSSPRLRAAVGWGVTGVVALGALLWAPGALRQEALTVVPASKKTEIGATLLGHLQEAMGPACRDPLGAEALARLQDRALGGTGQAVVLPLGPAAPIRLPGGITVLSREMVERAAEPAVVAGQLLTARAADPDPLGRLLNDAGPWATFRLLTTGNIDPAVLEEHAADLLADPVEAPGAETMGPAFAEAEVPLTPYALDRDPTGETVADLIDADPYTPGEAPVLLNDLEWVALQEICRGQ